MNETPDSTELTPAERERALQVISDLVELWPAQTRDAAEIYFGEIREALRAGTAVDLDNSSEQFKHAFAIVFGYVADACPGGFG